MIYSRHCRDLLQIVCYLLVYLIHFHQISHLQSICSLILSNHLLISCRRHQNLKVININIRVGPESRHSSLERELVISIECSRDCKFLINNTIFENFSKNKMLKRIILEQRISNDNLSSIDEMSNAFSFLFLK
jgi:hypothetical protein